MPAPTRRVLITGAGRGIGRAIALRLAADGADIAVADLNKGAAEAVAEEIGALGRRALALQVDVRDRTQVLAMVRKTADALDGLDIFFNNAGIILIKDFLEVEEEHWDQIMDVNLKGVFLCGQAVARYMVDNPTPEAEATRKIINTASLASRVGVPDMMAYAASKAGVMSLTRSMAMALAEHQITVNALAPGIVDTDMWTYIDEERANAAGIAVGEPMRKRVAAIPLQRAATPEDVAGMASFLAGPDSDYITGQTFNIDGGARPS